MYFSILFFLTLNILLTLGAPSKKTSFLLSNDPPQYEQVQQQLINVSQQLDRVELQLNNSINQLLEKIDENSHDIMHMIQALHTSQIDGSRQSSIPPVSALLIIDVQNDFINGTLAVRNTPSKHNGEEVVPVINHLLDSLHFDVIAYSHDWHPSNHISFFDNLPLRSHLLTNDSIPLADLRVYSTATFAINNLIRINQTLWPRHCVQHSVGAELHPDLKVINTNNTGNISVVHIYKGIKPDIDSYSAFWDNLKLSETSLNQQLKEKNVTQVFVTGIATDWCVYSTAVDAIEHDYKTFIIEDACRGVDEQVIKERLKDFTQKNGHIIQSDQVKDYVQS